MRPRLSDLRACGPIEPYADLIIFPHRPDHDAPIRRREKTVFAELIVAKNRSGPLGIAETCWNTAIAQFDG
jgi:replicative DNA helicase